MRENRELIEEIKREFRSEFNCGLKDESERVQRERERREIKEVEKQSQREMLEVRQDI